jgi:hypothetical protein
MLPRSPANCLILPNGVDYFSRVRIKGDNPNYSSQATLDTPREWDFWKRRTVEGFRRRTPEPDSKGQVPRLHQRWSMVTRDSEANTAAIRA